MAIDGEIEEFQTLTGTFKRYNPCLNPSHFVIRWIQCSLILDMLKHPESGESVS